MSGAEIGGELKSTQGAYSQISQKKCYLYAVCHLDRSYRIS